MKKAQMTQTMVLIVSVIVIIGIAAVFTIIVKSKGKAVEQKLLLEQRYLEGNELALGLIKSNIYIEGREISVAEAMALVLYNRADENELRISLNEILQNFGYTNETALWQLSLIDKQNNKATYSIAQKKDIRGFDSATVRGETAFPHPLSADYLLRLETLED